MLSFLPNNPVLRFRGKVYYHHVMIWKLEVVSVGDSLGVILPDEILSTLGVGVGDTLFAFKIPAGIELTADGDVAEQMIAAKIMQDEHELLRMLAD